MAFLVGMHRSGTTLLTNMLNSHPQLVATPENEFILFTLQGFYEKDFSDPAIVNSFLSIFDQPFNREMSIWKPAETISTSISQRTKKDFANVCREVYLNYPFAQDKTNVKCIIDKNPSYSLYIDKLHRVFPNAKYIILARDFRDNVLSRMKYGQERSSVFNLGMMLNFYYDRIFDTVKKYGLSHFILRYEDLVARPEEVLKQLCEYLGVTYSPEMLHFQDLSKKMLSHAEKSVSADTFGKISAMHGKLSGEVNKERMNAYQDELSAKQIAQLDYVCSFYATRFNYAFTPTRPRAGWRILRAYNWLKVRLYDAWLHLYYDLPIGLRIRWLRRS